MADNSKVEKILKELKDAIKPDSEALKRLKELGQEAGKKLPKKES